MLTCISCSKQRMEDGGEEAPRGTTPTSNDAVKSLTTQIKDMALKISGAYKCKPGPADGNFNTGQRCYPEFDTISEGVPYPYVHCGARPDSAFVSDRALRGTEITTSTQYGKVMPQKDGDNEPKEWMAQVEPGVQITFVSLPHGGNDLKRIRFSRDMFDKWQAQRWWGENYDRIMELYNVQKFNHQAINSPRRSEDEGASTYPMLGCTRESPRVTPLNKDWTPTYGGKDYFPPNDLQHHNNPGSRAQSTGDQKREMSPVEESGTTTAYRYEATASISTASDIEPEWIEEDEPGVYITIRQLVNGTRELRHVRFSRERFEEVHAKHWWETNRERIQTQYLC